MASRNITKEASFKALKEIYAENRGGKKQKETVSDYVSRIRKEIGRHPGTGNQKEEGTLLENRADPQSGNS